MISRKHPLLEHPGLQSAWPLFDIIFKRRSRRFAMGAEIPGGPTKYKSRFAPMPLDELEEALLVEAATGVTGRVLADLPFRDDKEREAGGNTILTWLGLTFASPCNSHEARLIYWNDEGTYFIKFENIQPTKTLEFEGPADQEKVLHHFRAARVKLFDGRPQYPRRYPVMLPFNLWDSDIPGSTIFLPVLDTTEESINALLLMVGWPDGGIAVVDDIQGGGRYAGCERWVREGLLKEKLTMPLSLLGIVSIIEAGFMEQNLQLAVQAMGLGGWVHATSNPLVLLGGTPLAKGLGFRFITPKYGQRARGGAGVGVPSVAPIPVGLDGILETHLPVYYGSMDKAVDHIVEKKFGAGGIYTPACSQIAVRGAEGFASGVPVYSEAQVQCVKDICNYCWETYGRFPVAYDPIVTTAWFQAHHLDLEFYDRFYGPESYTETQARHMELWHGPAAQRALEAVRGAVAV